MGQTDITIAGLGGQGSILTGVILGSAAVTLKTSSPPRPRHTPPS